MSDIPQEHKLYQHIKHTHVPRNVNDVHQEEHDTAGFNTKLAILLTRRVGSMQTAYAFVVLAVVGLLAILGVLSPLVALLVAWTSQTLIQLVLLPVIMVGQNVLNRKQELQAQEAFDTTMRTYHDIEQIMKHLDAQDGTILEIEQKTLELAELWSLSARTKRARKNVPEA